MTPFWDCDEIYKVMSFVVSVKGLKKSFKEGFIPSKKEVLKGVDFQTHPGRVVGFLGANGSGKTTTMKCVLGLIFPDEGEVRFFGGKKLDKNVKAKIGFLPEHPYFYKYLTGSEFLYFYAQMSSLKTSEIKQRAQLLLKKVDLDHAKDQPLKDYSKGMLQKIGIVQALIHRPELVILDEPMSGLDPDGRYHISEIIKDISKEEGVSVFFSSHLLNDMEKLCDDLLVLNEGKVHYEGAMKEFLGQIDSQYEISYKKEGESRVLSVKTEKKLQESLDELRGKNFIIESVLKKQMSLEEKFVKEVLKSK